MTSNSSGSPSPVRSTLITACLHSSRFNSVVVDPNTWADDSKKVVPSLMRTLAEDIASSAAGVGKSGNVPPLPILRFPTPTYDFQRIHRIVGSGCAVERDRDCGPFPGSTQEACAVRQERSDSVAPRLQIAGERFDTDVAAGL